MASSNPISILVYPDSDNHLMVKLPFSKERVAKIRTITGRRWDAQNKCWRLPDTPDMRTRLKNLFGEQLRFESSPLQKPVLNVAQLEILGAAKKELYLFSRSADTHKSYLGHIRRFLLHVQKSPTALIPEDGKEYLYNLLKEDKSRSYANQCISALKLLFDKVLKQNVDY